MNQPQENRCGSLVAHDEAAKILQPGVCALDDPTSSVTPERSAILRRRLLAVSSMRNYQFDSAMIQPLSQRVAVVSLVGDYAVGARTGTTWTEIADPNRLEGDLGELDFRRGRRVQVNSERSTLAINQNHKLRSLPALGLADFEPPFLALKKVPSRKHSSQRTCPRSLSWARKVRQSFSSVPSLVQRPSRRWTVLFFPYRGGNSLHWAPVQRIQRMPSKHSRSSAQGRPPLRLGLRTGRCLRVSSHCLSVSPRQVMIRLPAVQAFLGGGTNHTIFPGVIG